MAFNYSRYNNIDSIVDLVLKYLNNKDLDNEWSFTGNGFALLFN